MRERVLKKLLARYYLATFFGSFSLATGVLIPFFTEWGGLTLTQTQTLQSWFFLCIFLLEIPTGALADWFGRKVSIALGTTLLVPAVLLYGWIPKWEVFIVAELVFALGYAFTSGAREALVYDWLERTGQTARDGEVFGWNHAFSLSGMILAAPLGSWIAAETTLNLPMLLTAIPYTISAVLTWTLPDRARPRKYDTSYWTTVWQGLAVLRARPDLRSLAYDMILVSTSGYFVIWLYQSYLKYAAVPVEAFGWYHSWLVSIQVVIAAQFLRLKSWCGGWKGYLRCSAALVALGYLVALAWPSPAAGLIYLTLAGGFGLSRHKIMKAYLSRLIPPELRATTLSSIEMASKTVLIVMNPLIGYLTDQTVLWALMLMTLFPLVAWLMSPARSLPMLDT